MLYELVCLYKGFDSFVCRYRSGPLLFRQGVEENISLAHRDATGKFFIMQHLLSFSFS